MDDLGERLIAHAALSGPFEPARFRYRPPGDRRGRKIAAGEGQGVGDDEWSRALAGLAPLCDEVAEDGVQKWVMRTADRGRELARLASRPGLVQRLYRLRPPRKGDAFATTLLACVGRAPLPDAASVPAEDLREAIGAAIFAGGMVEEPRRSAIKDFEKALYRSAVAQAQRRRLDAVLPQPLCGRDAERAAVVACLRRGRIVPPLQPTGGGPEASGRLLLTGSPGMGKSAFLADLVQALGREDPAPFVVAFDFDQLTLTRGSVVAWAEELTRQIAAQAPEVESRLSRIRSEHAARRANTDRPPGEPEARALLGDAWEAMRELRPRPLVLIADTIEEVTARDSVEQFERAPQDTLFSQLVTWANDLQSMPAPPLGPFVSARLVAAGRTAPPVADEVLAGWFQARLDLPELDDAAANELLAREPKLDPATCARSVAAIGGHPLHLLMLRKHLAGLRRRERAALLAALEAEGLRGALPEAVTQVLYSRFLDRLRIEHLPSGLRPDDIRKFAHPGLLLREVDARALAEVIGPATDVDLSDPGLAAAALAALRDQVWLVVPGEHGSVRHRPDVRRVMLPMMLDPQNAGISRMLGAAVTWFESRPGDPGALQEAAYLRALRGAPEDVARFASDPSLAPSVVSLGGSDIAVMPLVSQAILKFLARPDEPLSDAELAALPDPWRTEAGVRQEGSALKAFGGAARKAPGGVGTTLEKPHFAFDWGQLSSDAYEVLENRTLHDAVEVAFLESDFDYVAELGSTAIRHIRRWPDLARPLGLRTPFHETWLWRSMLAFALHPPQLDADEPLLRNLRAIEGALAVDPLSSSALGQPSLDQAAFDLLPLVEIADPGRERPRMRVWPWGPRPWLRDFRELRLAASFAGLRNALVGQDEVEIALITAALPIFADPLEEAFEILERDAPAEHVRPERQSLEELIVGVRSHDEAWTDRIAAVYDRVDELSLEPRGSWSLAVYPRRDGPAARRAVAALLRGTTPELHASIVTSLIRLPPDVLDAAVGQAALASRSWPPRLTAEVREVAALGGRSKAPALRRLVRWLDLCGMLAPFLGDLRAHQDTPDLAAPLQLLRALDRWWLPAGAGELEGG